MKKLLCMLFVLTMLLPIVAGVAEISSWTYFHVPCTSNLIEMETVMLASYQGDLYISAEDAAALSGYTFADDSFIRGSREERPALYTPENSGVSWVALESAMGQLDTRVYLDAFGSLSFLARKVTPDDLYRLTDRCVNATEQYSLSLLVMDEMITAYSVLASAYNRLTSLAVISSIFGSYDEEIYQEILADVLDLSDEEEMLDALLKGNKLLNEMEKISKEMVDKKGKSVEELFATGQVGEFYVFLDVYGKAVDPVALLTEEVFKNKIEGFAVKGMGVFDEIELYKYMVSLLTINQYSSKLVGMTFSEDMLSRLGAQPLNDMLPRNARKPVADILKFATLDNTRETILQVLDQQLYQVFFETAEDVGEDLLSISSWLKLVAKGGGLIMDQASPGLSDQSEWAEKLLYMFQLQDAVDEMYGIYRQDDIAVLNAKYAALMYLRIAQVSMQSFAEVADTAGREALDLLEKDMEAIAAIEDTDLLFTPVTNAKLDVDAVLALVVAMPEEDFAGLNPDTPQDAPQSTPVPGLDAAEFNGHQYCVFLLDEVRTWQEAQAYCESLGGYLATITSREEDEFLYQYLKQQGYSNGYFGLNDVAEQGIWCWVTGEPLMYSNWHSGEPSGKNERYGMYYYGFTDGSWNDGDFGVRTWGYSKAFICEWGDYAISEPIEPEGLLYLVSENYDWGKSMEANLVATLALPVGYAMDPEKHPTLHCENDGQIAWKERNSESIQVEGQELFNSISWRNTDEYDSMNVYVQVRGADDVFTPRESERVIERGGYTFYYYEDWLSASLADCHLRTVIRTPSNKQLYVSVSQHYVWTDTLPKSEIMLEIALELLDNLTLVSSVE